MSAPSIFGPEPLRARRRVDGFTCGVASLDEYLRIRAASDQAAEKARTYVVTNDDHVVGYFTIAGASIEPEHATERAARGQGAQAIPAILLARLAVDVTMQGRGLGEALLTEALARAVNAADIIGARVVLVHAVDATARGFYLKYGFEPSPCHELQLMMLMKDIRKALG